MSTLPHKVLVANRGEIACRVLRTLRAMGIGSVAVCSDVDANAPFVWLADEVLGLGEPRAYLDIPRLLEAAKKSGATAIHPGYGFLSENPRFAAACQEAGLVFIGPSEKSIREFGDKREAGRLAKAAGVPVIPGARPCDTVEEAQAAAEEVGYPVLLKAAAGGGGKGMRRVHAQKELAEAFAAAGREAQGAFNDARLLVEKFVFPARHVEVQVFGDGKRAIALGERECSLQRRYQKVLEESPSPGIHEATRQALFGDATRLLSAAGYRGAGTVEFLVGPDGQHYFLEVNTRLQVEHPVTELRFGVDLVRWQIEVAHGASLDELAADLQAPRGAAIEVRLNAEDAFAGFLPQSGEVAFLRWPAGPGVRVDAGVEEGSAISSHYDPLLAKLIVWGETRASARSRLLGALRETIVLGLPTNLTFLLQVLEREFFAKGETFTTTLEEQRWQAPPLPPYADAAVALAKAPAVGATEAGVADPYSPWRSLGAFRVGAGSGGGA